MVLSLPEPRYDRLERSPLKLVACELRYAKSPVASKFSAANAIQEALQNRGTWKLAQVENRSLSVAVGDTGVTPPVVASQSGWKLTSEPGGWAATIMPDSVVLETTRYEDWPDFLEWLVTLLRAVEEAVAPEAAGRLGLRYVDRIDDPEATSPAEWEQWIRPEVLGIALHPDLRSGVVETQQQVAVTDGDRLMATIRHGFSRDEGSDHLPYVMDFDTFRDGVQAFDVDSIVADLERLHRFAVQLFQSMITQPLYQYLRGDQ